MNFTMPPVSAGFNKRAGWYARNLQSDLALHDIHCAAIAGVAGAESGLLPIQERGVRPPHGGFGWHQWTADRRDDFAAFAMTLDVANYFYAIRELQNSEAHALEQLKKTTTLEAAVYTFIMQFERPAAPQTEFKRALPLAQLALANK